MTEGTWVHGLLDGDGSLTRNDGSSITLFFKDSVREKPSLDVLPPCLPAIKLIAP